MEVVPTSVLRLIFENYTRGSHNEGPRTPVPLLTVCRRWYAVLTTTPTLWSRVPITFDSIRSMKWLIKWRNWALEPYLARSEGPNLHVPLDIEIRWLLGKNDTYDPLDFPINEAARNQRKQHIIDTRRDRLHDLLRVLAGQPNHAKQGHPHLDNTRIRRWRSLVLDLDGVFPVPSELGTTIQPFDCRVCATCPSLESIVIRNANITFMNIEAPNLEHLTLDHAEVSVFSAFNCVSAMSINAQCNLHAVGLYASRTLKVVDVSRIPNWKLPENVLFPALTTIALDHLASSHTLDSISTIFNVYRPLETLVVKGIEPERLAFILSRAPNLRCLALSIGSHCLTWKSTDREDVYEAIKGARCGRGYSASLRISPYDLVGTHRILKEMKLRGGEVTALELHMAVMIHIAKHRELELERTKVYNRYDLGEAWTAWRTSTT